MSLDALALKNLFLSCEFQILHYSLSIRYLHSKNNNNKKNWQMPILEGELDNLELIEL